MQAYTDDESINALFVQVINAPRKSVKVATVLSTILPGAGQVYAGNWKSGLNALVLNGWLGFVTVDAASWTTCTFLRYYWGNYYRAGRAVEQHNEGVAHQFAEKILQALQHLASNC